MVSSRLHLKVNDEAANITISLDFSINGISKHHSPKENPLRKRSKILNQESCCAYHTNYYYYTISTYWRFPYQNSILRIKSGKCSNRRFDTWSIHTIFSKPVSKVSFQLFFTKKINLVNVCSETGKGNRLILLGDRFLKLNLTIT